MVRGAAFPLVLAAAYCAKNDKGIAAAIAW